MLSRCWTRPIWTAVPRIRRSKLAERFDVTPGWLYWLAGGKIDLQRMVHPTRCHKSKAERSAYCRLYQLEAMLGCLALGPPSMPGRLRVRDRHWGWAVDIREQRLELLNL